MENVIFLSKKAAQTHKTQIKSLPLRLLYGLLCRATNNNLPFAHYARWIFVRHRLCMASFVVLLFAAFVCSNAQSRVSSGHVNWLISAQSVNEGYKLAFEAEMENGWHIYSQTCDVTGLQTVFYVDADSPVKYTSPIEEIGEMENMIQEDGSILAQYSKKVKFTLDMLPKKPATLSGQVKYVACNGGSCSGPHFISFEFIFND